MVGGGRWRKVGGRWKVKRCWKVEGGEGWKVVKRWKVVEGDGWWKMVDGGRWCKVEGVAMW